MSPTSATRTKGIPLPAPTLASPAQPAPPMLPAPAAAADAERLWTLAGGWFGAYDGLDKWCVQVWATTYEHARAITAAYLAQVADEPRHAQDPTVMFTQVADIVTAFYIAHPGRASFAEAAELARPTLLAS